MFKAQSKTGRRQGRGGYPAHSPIVGYGFVMDHSFFHWKLKLIGTGIAHCSEIKIKRMVASEKQTALPSPSLALALNLTLLLE
jgi:hypothetical protein